MTKADVKAWFDAKVLKLIRELNATHADDKEKRLVISAQIALMEDLIRELG